MVKWYWVPFIIFSQSGAPPTGCMHESGDFSRTGEAAVSRYRSKTAHANLRTRYRYLGTGSIGSFGCGALALLNSDLTGLALVSG